MHNRKYIWNNCRWIVSGKTASAYLAYMFTSKELYIMNGGNKTYIGKDGFADIYSATPEEEAEWSKEVVARAIGVIEKEENKVSLSFAIENLRFHKYKELNDLLTSKMQHTSIGRKEIFTEALSATR